MNWMALPAPYPDELLYSVIARWKLQTGLNSHDVSLRLFANRLYSQLKALPTRLEHLISYLPSTVGLDEMIYRHTLYPYYSTFCSPGRMAMMKKEMKDPHGRKFGTKTARTPSLACCPKCLSEDMQKYGEPYWHRVHQLPGVLVCPYHNTMLIKSCPVCKTPLMDTDPGSYVYTPTFCPKRHSLAQVEWNMNENLFAIALDSLLVLEGGIQKINIELLQQAYISCLKEMVGDSRREWSSTTAHSYYFRTDNLKKHLKSTHYTQLRRTFVSYYGEDVLRSIGAYISVGEGPVTSNDCGFVGRRQRSGYQQGDWLYSLFFHRIPQDTSPLFHLLVMNFFSGNAQAFLIRSGLVANTTFTYLEGGQEVAATNNHSDVP